MLLSNHPRENLKENYHFKYVFRLTRNTKSEQVKHSTQGYGSKNQEHEKEMGITGSKINIKNIYKGMGGEGGGRREEEEKERRKKINKTKSWNL